MKKFDVEITETLQRKVSVEAASQEDAERMVTQAWNNQDYVLDSGDFTGVDFKTDRLRPGEEQGHSERYRAQIEAYSAALSRITGVQVCRRVLWYFATGTGVEI